MKSASVALLLSSPDSARLWRAALSSQGVGGHGFDPGRRDGLLALRALLRDRGADAALIDTSFFAASGCDAPREVAELRNVFSGLRVFLLIPGRVHVADAEQRWVSEWGIEALLPGDPSAEPLEALGAPLAAVMGSLGLGAANTARLEAAVRGLAVPGGASGHFAGLRALQQAGIDPGRALAAMRTAPVEDRNWRGATYRDCFVAAEAVEAVRTQLRIDPVMAETAGRVLQGLGQVHHVVRGQAFADDHLFFRFGAGDAALARLVPAALVARMRGSGGVEVRDRRYLGKTYPASFVANEAIDWLCAHCGLSVGGAEDVGQRLLELGLLHHVVDEHPFHDGAFYYRFLADERL